MSLSEQYPLDETRPQSSHKYEIVHERFLAAVQDSANLFWFLAPSGEMQDICSNWLAFTGQKEKDCLGRGWLGALHPTDQSQIEEALHKAIASKHTTEIECHIRRHDNSYRLFCLHVIPVRKEDGTIREMLLCGNDVTNQIQKEHMGEEQVRLALKASGVGMWDWDLTTGQFVWTDQEKAIFGLPSDTPVTYELFLNTLHPDDRERVRQNDKRVIAEKREYSEMYRVVWPDGSVHWVIDRARGILDTSGNMTHLVGATLDITELKRKEEQLQDAHEEVVTILESITDAFSHVDAQWRYIYVNRRMEEYLGRSKDVLLGKRLWDIVPGMRGTPFEHHYREAMATQRTNHFEAIHPLLKKWVEVYVYPTPKGFFVYYHDIHERKQVEKALQESNELFQRLVASNIIGIIITDVEGNVHEANDAFLSLLGYTREDLAAGRMQWRSITSLNTQEQDAQEIEETLKTGAVRPYEKEYVTKDGRRVPVLVGRALYRRKGTSSLLICFVLDLTDRKAIERQKDLFLGMTGHELKTPLAALRGTLQLVQRRLKRVESKDYPSAEWDGFTQGLTASLEKAVHQIDIQTHLINDLLDVSRITSNTLKLSLSRCGLRDIIHETVEDIRVIEPARTLLLAVPEQRPVYIWADCERIGQVITNYITNALRYSGPDQPVVIGLTIQEDSARVWVQDKGPGLTKQARQDIWQCFHQAEGVPVKSGSGKGLGLGLYICRMLIAQHHGEVGVESTPGEGSTFWFSLPIVP